MNGRPVMMHWARSSATKVLSMPHWPAMTPVPTSGISPSTAHARSSSGGFSPWRRNGMTKPMLVPNPGMLWAAPPSPLPSPSRASYSSRQPGEVLSARKKMVPAPIRVGGHLENASHLSPVVRALYFGDFFDHASNAVKPPTEPLVPFH